MSTAGLAIRIRRALEAPAFASDAPHRLAARSGTARPLGVVAFTADDEPNVAGSLTEA
jgi:hypothetical protein